MNPEAGNALLKSLEEPPPDTMFILISHLASDLLPTLLSRCQQIGFNPISQTRISNELSKRFDGDSAHIQAITSMAGGSLGQAFAIMEKTRGKTSFFSFRAFLFNELTTLKNRPPIDLFMFSEKLSSKKDQAIEAIDMLFSFVRDMIICKYSPEKIINRDISEKIIGASRDYSLPSLIKLTEHIVTARKSILSNGSLRLALDVMAINIKRV
jgi:DNA polymerase-3 subunit delta'